MAKEPIFFAFYASDFVSGTHYLTTNAVGCYVRLLCHQWQTGSIPNDEKLMARICGCSATEFTDAWQEIENKFVAAKGSSDLVNQRLEEERVKTLEKSRKARESANARWQSADANASSTQARRTSERKAIKNQNQNQNQSDKQRQNTSTIASEKRRQSANEEAFEKFWQIVHRKVGKTAASKAYARAVGEVCREKNIDAAEARDFLFTTMQAFAQTPAANPREHSAVHPSTWLNQGRFLDDQKEWGNAQVANKVKDGLSDFFNGEQA